MIITQSCLKCKQPFQTRRSEVKRGQGKFCSISCSTKYHHEQRPKPQPNVKCAYCSEDFYIKSNRKKASKSGLFFCCRAHKDLAQKLGGIEEIMPPHYGLGNGKHDYRAKALSYYPNKCKTCGWDEHIEVLEVNHIDINRNNNDISNLEILCPTHHQVFHFTTKTGKWSKL